MCTDVKYSSRPTCRQGPNFHPRTQPRSIRPRPRSRSHAMLASFSWKLSSWPRCQSSELRQLCYVLLWLEIVAYFINNILLKLTRATSLASVSALHVSLGLDLGHTFPLASLNIVNALQDEALWSRNWTCVSQVRRRCAVYHKWRLYLQPVNRTSSTLLITL